MSGEVEAIHLAATPAELPQPTGTVVVELAGLVGDYHHGRGNITLVESEALAGLHDDTGIELSAAEVRRQVLTRGIRLNDLVGKRFAVGEVECLGVELCEPCAKLQRLTKPGVLKGLVHRGGLRADIVSEGRIAVGDRVAGP
ncbi:MAG TPA: MOSC domain-containing protein [Thermoleophilaceae bacterium]|nr:MOSC domain-containing protein [Thermoleophilaceae bacterium]